MKSRMVTGEGGLGPHMTLLGPIQIRPELHPAAPLRLSGSPSKLPIFRASQQLKEEGIFIL